MYIKITKENIDYINKARKKYNKYWKDPITLHHSNIRIIKNDADCLLSANKEKNENYITFEEFKRLYPLEEINKPIELW